MENKIGIMLLFNCPGVEKSFEYKIEIVDFLIDIVGILYENILLMAKINRENVLVRSLISISQIINSTIEYRKLLAVFAEVVSQFMSTKTVGIFLFNKATHELELVQQIGISEEKTIRYAASKIKRSELEVDNHDPSETLKNHPNFSIFVSGAQVCIFPLIIRHRLIGFLYVEKEEPDKMKLELMTLLAEHASKSIENAYLFDQILKQNEQLIETTEILKRAEQKLILNEKLAAMGKFASAVAHEIRNPLTIMLGALQSAKNATAEEKEQILSHLDNRYRSYFKTDDGVFKADESIYI
jgi:transcriptional regulator with GAF, ATPase, and Fis domain